MNVPLRLMTSFVSYFVYASVLIVTFETREYYPTLLCLSFCCYSRRFSLVFIITRSVGGNRIRCRHYRCLAHRDQRVLSARPVVIGRDTP